MTQIDGDIKLQGFGVISAFIRVYPELDTLAGIMKKTGDDRPDPDSGTEEVDVTRAPKERFRSSRSTPSSPTSLDGIITI
jgi:hypothetical protein